jgi:hypothetical protein
MVKPKRVNPILVGVLLAALGAALWVELRPRAAALTPLVPVVPAADVEKGESVPRIGLSRLEAKVAPSSAGETDVFQFGAPSTKVVPRATPPPEPVDVALPVPVASPTPPPLPVMNVKYIGTVGDKKGLKVAVLMTDRKEVLTGRPGDVVANRLKIVSIGLESVDVQDVGSDHVRRIPLRAN